MTHRVLLIALALLLVWNLMAIFFAQPASAQDEMTGGAPKQGLGLKMTEADPTKVAKKWQKMLAIGSFFVMIIVVRWF